MITLPRLRCPGCGKAMGPVNANNVPPANTYKDCLRRCPRCGIGATNAKNPAKVKYIHAEPSPDIPPQTEPPEDIPPQKP